MIRNPFRTGRWIGALAIAPLAILCAACPGGGSPSAGGGDVALGPRVSFNGLSLQAPTAWVTEQPSSSMRVAQYRVPAVQGDPEPGECAVFHFAGQGGSVQANLDRWYGQFQQPDGSNTADKARVENFTAGPLRVTYVQVAGTYSGGMGSASGPKPGFKLVAGVVETADSPWFVKCTGPEATMTAAAPAVRAMLATVQP